jgi:hypothetical protein
LDTEIISRSAGSYERTPEAAFITLSGVDTFTLTTKVLPTCGENTDGASDRVAAKDMHGNARKQKAIIV